MLFFLTMITMLLSSPFIFDNIKNKNSVVLKILNSEDYIDKEIISDFEEKNNVKIVYDTFDTQENMFNIIKTNKIQYDLICVSDYMFQKIMNYDKEFIEKLDENLIPNYYDKNKNEEKSKCSDFIEKILKNEGIHEKAVCYMWGFIGLVYNVDFPIFKKQKLEEKDIDNDMKNWNILWDKKYQKTISIKDSIRDTYALGILKTFKKDFEDKTKNKTKIFNYGNENDKDAIKHIEEVKNNLKELKKNIFGFENDSGKEDIANNKIGINFSWSGDAVYSIKKARQNGINLHFSVPDNGTTNIWFDQWIMTKYAKINKKSEIAHRFLNFISNSKNVIRNTKKIGYTSAIASEEIFKYYSEVYEDLNSEEEYDLDYFFNNKRKIKISKEKKYQLKAQFPESKNIENLVIMKDFGKNNELILNMWNELKSEDNNFYIYEIVIILIESILFIYIFYRIKKIKYLLKK